MKICMLTRTYPPRIGGPGALVHRLSRSLTEEGFDITIITQGIRGAKRFEVDNGVKIHRAFVLSDTNEFTLYNLGVGILSFTAKVLENKKNDVFHAHDVSVAGFSGCLAKQMINKPFVLKYGGNLLFEYLAIKNPPGWDSKRGWEGTLTFRHPYTLLLNRIQRWYFDGYDLIAPDSTYGRDFLVRLGVPKEKIKLLHNGVDTEIFHPSAKREAGIKRVFTTTRLIEMKGTHVLIRAMRDIVEEYDAELHIAGTGPELERLRKLTLELGLQKNVVFLGYVSRENMPKCLAESDVFVLPSYHETTSNAVLEAMASGIPCIVSDVPGMKEVIDGGCALKARVGDPTDLAEKLRLLFSDPKLRRSLADKAREKMEREYSWEKILKEYVKLYEELSI